MAPALGSNVFRVSTGLYSKPDSKTSRPTVTIYGRTNPFGIGKPKAEPSEGEDVGSSKPNKFFFDLSKIPDAKSLIPVVTSPSMSLFASPRRKDPNTVFVAGATGQSGTRIARTLLRQGFAVRAGVPELDSAQELARLAATYKVKYGMKVNNGKFVQPPMVFASSQSFCFDADYLPRRVQAPQCS